jgi:hypothetical protein
MQKAATRQHPTNHEAEIQRNAYNAAFNELGLGWYWDSDTHHRLQSSTDERERIRVYLQAQHAHLLKAYDADFLVNAIHATKQRQCINMPSRPAGIPHLTGLSA